ncbi:4-hydroxy-tetrahydrodipicolinate synthase [Capnocytophaga felis]|nr:4-hydroxy-tetrahydrodipicolinate synthase [Capnocytophaga felis]
MMEQLKGTGVALITPFTSDNKVDTEALTKIVNYVIDGGVKYLVVLGTTSEAPTLTKDEKKLVCETVIEANNKRLPLVIGIGGNNTQTIIDEINSFDLSEFTAILSVTPYYNKPSQNGLYAHFSEIAKNSPLPVILYNVPGRTGVSMNADTINRLAKNFENIIAVKEASGDLSLDMAIIKDKPEDFLFISGDDFSTLPSVFMGGSGVISVIGIAFPKEFSEMVRLGLQGEVEKARVIHYQLMKQTHFAFKEGNPVGIKAILAEKGLCSPFVRLPLVEASNALKAEIKADIQIISKL